MDYGIFSHIERLDDLERDLRAADADGIASYWLTQGFGHDALTVIGAYGRQLSRLRIGTAVVPVYPRHPMALAQQALTTNMLLGGRLVLGVGPSHPQVVEPCWGMSYERPARYMREYLTALTGALTQRVRYTGEVITARGDLTISGDPPAPAVMVSALGPKMLELTGALAAGTITWMVGPRTLTELTVPAITAAARTAGRPAPEIVVTAAVCVTDDPTRARAAIDPVLGWYDDKPSYRAMLDREGLQRANQMAIVGDADEVRAEIDRYARAGASTFAAQFYGTPEERAATRALIGELAGTTRSTGDGRQ
ncbi:MULTISPECIES: TIGR03564 family F420-dependent LLM class oxidoreductase [unclassified Micromonospora]|uniref:TIGR03564 family F420-dependent LLM class oxidoreductase n=1 Tax=unclassified Micromonospora TaxID=2617518 RepID=UPI003A8B55E6